MSKKNNTLLAKLDIKNHILIKELRGKPLTEKQKAHNSVHTKIRCHIERVFAHLKGTQGLERTRYLGIEKKTAWAFMAAFAYNLKRVAKSAKIALPTGKLRPESAKKGKKKEAAPKFSPRNLANHLRSYQSLHKKTSR